LDFIVEIHLDVMDIGIPFIATEIATGRRTEKKGFSKRFGVATIVILENYGKP